MSITNRVTLKTNWSIQICSQFARELKKKILSNFGDKVAGCAFAEKLLKTYLSKNRSGERTPYCGILIDYLTRHLKKWSQSKSWWILLWVHNRKNHCFCWKKCNGRNPWSVDIKGFLEGMISKKSAPTELLSWVACLSHAGHSISKSTKSRLTSGIFPFKRV